MTQDMLGHLEMRVMEVLWAHGESNVHDVVQRLGRPLAYTTVMTTLDRLFKKSLLLRRKWERAFLYAPRWTRPEWEQKRASEFMAGFLASPQASGERLISFHRFAACSSKDWDTSAASASLEGKCR